jgi:predicted ATPase/class 3 adenylate cyclase/Tfp pilus assembly protein PilF
LTEAPLPSGTVTFLFSDIEGSAPLWEAAPDAMRTALARHNDILHAAIADGRGRVFKTIGDALCAAFAVPTDAIAAAIAAQRAFVAEPWPPRAPIKVRMAVHTGAVELRDGDYFGAALNRVARLLPSGHGGQILVSQIVGELCRDALPPGVSLRALGTHQLRDLSRPEQVYELAHVDLPTDFPPIRSLSTHPNNLPRQLSSFIGRASAIAEVKGLLERSRLLTLTGAGGSGKTRLCLQVAAESLELFTDGAWLTELAPLADPGLVPQTLAMTLGVTEVPGKPIVETLTEHLKAKRLLLLLDNCEHLLDACAKVVHGLVRACPDVRIMATSREALGVDGEQAYRVPSLSLPDRNAVYAPADLSRFESVRLFVERAELVHPQFEVNAHNARALASLCCHLDGIPLAIELAAARARSLSVEEIDGKLDQRFRLLTGGSRTALPRQQTLRSLIDWSYDLLHAPERLLLQRLAVFAGGWTLAAAEAICADEDLAVEEVLDRLTSLADKSLVVAETGGLETRYRLLETVRQYARDRLVESGGGRPVRDRHRDYFLALALATQAELVGAEQAAWLRRLEEEHENLRTSLDWSLAADGTGEGLRLCGALYRFWLTRGHLTEARQWCSRMLGTAGRERTPERATALNAAGNLAYYQGDYVAARALHEESLSIMRNLGDREGTAGALNGLGNIALDHGDYDAARALYEECLGIKRELADRRGIATSLNNLGNVACEQCDFASARTLFEECLAIMRELGNRGGVADLLHNLGSVAIHQGDYEAAQALHEQSLAIVRELGDQGGIANSLETLGTVAHDQGDYRSAGRLHAEGLAIRRGLGERRNIAYSLEGMAEVVAALGNPLCASRLWGAAEHLRANIGAPLPPNDRPRYDRCVGAARTSSNSDAAFARAWQEGAALELDAAIELALADFHPTE